MDHVYIVFGFDVYIYVCTWMHPFVFIIGTYVDAIYDVSSLVRTWMRFMMFDMFVLHVDASSLGC